MALLTKRPRMWKLFSPGDWCLSSPSLVLGSREVLQHCLAFSLHWNPEEVGCSTIGGRTLERDRQTSQREWAQTELPSSKFSQACCHQKARSKFRMSFSPQAIQPRKSVTGVPRSPDKWQPRLAIRSRLLVSLLTITCSYTLLNF